MPVSHARFNKATRRWESLLFSLPFIDGDYVLLTPKDILTKDDTWINKHDLVGSYDKISESIPNVELRAQINDYLLRMIPEGATSKEIKEVTARAFAKFPELLDYYVKYKEDHGDEATDISASKVKKTEKRFISQVEAFVTRLLETSDFFQTNKDAFEETYQRVIFLKQVIENNDGYKFFYVDGEPVKRESDLQLIFRLTWFATEFDVNSEVNNGRGPVDYKISRGSADKTLVEFKLAGNSKLKRNLENQVEVYEAANTTRKSIKVILFFSDAELEKVIRVLKKIGLEEGKTLVLIDARPTNKPSGSNT